MKNVLVLFVLNVALLAVGQDTTAHFDRAVVTSHGGKQIELHDVTIRYLREQLITESGPVSYIDGERTVIPWSDVLALHAAPINDIIGWHIVLTDGRVLPGLHGDLYVEGTRTGPIEPLGASPSFRTVITSYDPGGLAHVSVVVPGNLAYLGSP